LLRHVGCLGEQKHSEGCPTRDRSELGTQHNNAIVMGARMVGGHDRRWILEAQGLSIVKETLCAPTVPFILLNEMKKYNGYTYFSTGGSGGRHAMAVGIVNGDNYFFDPNFGMYKLGNVEFISFVGNHLTSVYADLLDDFATYNGRLTDRHSMKWPPSQAAILFHCENSSGRLKQSDLIAVRVGQPRRESPAADVFHILRDASALVDERLQRRPNVGDFAISEWSGHSLFVAIGIETDLLTTNPKADVIRILHIRLGAEQLGEHGLALGDVLDRKDDQIERVAHCQFVPLLV
jgi:hypothetical protein